jgi:hypothetical protein
MRIGEVIEVALIPRVGARHHEAPEATASGFDLALASDVPDGEASDAEAAPWSGAPVLALPAAVTALAFAPGASGSHLAVRAALAVQSLIPGAEATSAPGPGPVPGGEAGVSPAQRGTGPREHRSVPDVAGSDRLPVDPLSLTVIAAAAPALPVPPAGEPLTGAPGSWSHEPASESAVRDPATLPDAAAVQQAVPGADARDSVPGGNTRANTPRGKALGHGLLADDGAAGRPALAGTPATGPAAAALPGLSVADAAYDGRRTDGAAAVWSGEATSQPAVAGSVAGGTNTPATGQAPAGLSALAGGAEDHPARPAPEESAVPARPVAKGRPEVPPGVSGPALVPAGLSPERVSAPWGLLLPGKAEGTAPAQPAGQVASASDGAVASVPVPPVATGPTASPAAPLAAPSETGSAEAVQAGGHAGTAAAGERARPASGHIVHGQSVSAQTGALAVPSAPASPAAPAAWATPAALALAAMPFAPPPADASAAAAGDGPAGQGRAARMDAPEAGATAAGFVAAAHPPGDPAAPALGEAAPAAVFGAAEPLPEAPANMPAPAASRQPPHLRPEVAAGAAQQVAVALSHGPEGTVEIVLDPAELGPVRVGLSGSEGSIAVQITADRPETLDLFRRHADLLARELREAGYGTVSFDFGSQTPGRDQRSAPGHGYSGALPGDPAAAAAPPAASPRTPPPAARAGGLDLRL